MMNELKFVSTMEDIAFLYCYDMGPHGYFVNDVDAICNSIQKVFISKRSYFKNCMHNLHKSAAYMDHAELDMPLHFDMFLPIRLPMAVKAVFKKKERTVHLGRRRNYKHPFFSGNSVNALNMNLLFEKEMSEVIAQIGSVLGRSGVNFDLSYSTLKHNNQPFLHQLVAEARLGPYPAPRETNEVICIRFDFVLALEFDESTIILPSYFKPPTKYKWLAYGMVNQNNNHDPAQWAVLLPKWQNAHLAILLRGLNMSVMLYRMLYHHGCYRFALPAAIKFGYFLAIEDRGVEYMRLSIAELMVMTLGHQVSRNLGTVVANTAANDEQQKRAQEIYALLVHAFRFNVINADFIYKCYRIRYAPPTPCRLNRSLENLREPEDHPTSGRMRRTRRRSI